VGLAEGLLVPGHLASASAKHVKEDEKEKEGGDAVDEGWDDVDYLLLNRKALQNTFSLLVNNLSVGW